MTTRPFALALSALLLAAIDPAPAPAAGAPQDSRPKPGFASGNATVASKQMARVAWLVGTWAGEGDMPGYGPHKFKFTFEWTLNRTFLKTSFWAYVGEETVWHDVGMIGFDAEKKAFSTFNFGIDGLIGWGSGAAEKDGDETAKESIEVHGHTTDGRDFHWVLRRADKDTLESTCHIVGKDGKREIESKHVGKRADEPARQPAKEGPGARR